MRMGSRTPRLRLTGHMIDWSANRQIMVHPRPSSKRLIRACKRAAVSVASLSRLSAAAGCMSLVVVARAARQRARMQVTLQLISHGKSARTAHVRMAGSK
eukprot:scaffold70035_cov65-Phaeocystis_antarctica.AAC.4